MSNIYRLHYRAQLKEDISAEALQPVITECVKHIRNLQSEGKILTAALYYADKMLFLYYEAVGEAVSVVEPIAINPPLRYAWKYGGDSAKEIGGHVKNAPNEVSDAVAGNGSNEASDAVAENGSNEVSGAVVEAGEDVQAAVPHPADFLASLAPYLCVWPGQKGERLWVHMYHIYYHSMPKDAEDWKRAAVPEKRRGRIAFLRDDKLFSYTYFHKAIVEEGLLTGDRYQSIALHENILFSYFEEPKTITNVKNNQQENSKVIEDWLAVDPESHFIHMPEGEGENFMFLPAFFALGVEDME